MERSELIPDYAGIKKCLVGFVYSECNVIEQLKAESKIVFASRGPKIKHELDLIRQQIDITMRNCKAVSTFRSRKDLEAVDALVCSDLRWEVINGNNR